MLVAENNLLFLLVFVFLTEKKNQNTKYVCIFEQLISLNTKCLKLNILNIIAPNNYLCFIWEQKRTLTWCQYKKFCSFFRLFLYLI